VGTWSPTATAYSLQWERCVSTGGSCSPIAGGSASTYALTSTDAGSTLRVEVTASNTSGSSVATSNATSVVGQVSSGNVLWSGNFDTGTFGQYDSLQQYTTGRASIVGSASSLGGPSTPRDGSDFFQCRVVSGDNVYGGERCEALKGGLGIVNHADQWYGWSTAMPSSFPAAGLNVTGQFHSNSSLALNGQANIQFAVDYGQLLWVGSKTTPHWILGVNGCTGSNGQYVNQTCSKAFDLGAMSNWIGAGWVDVVLHVVWSDATNGTVELWMKKANSSTYTKYVSQVGNISNLYQGYSAYLKLGLYRAANSGLPDGYIWYDGVREGTTFASVDPAA
jgi:hypothetical protein